MLCSWSLSHLHGGLGRLPGAFGNRDTTHLVHTYCGHTLAIQNQMEQIEECGRGGMGFREWMKRQNGPKLFAMALHVLKAHIVWNSKSK